jgi:Fe-Mn family superoxide dismutase
MALDRRDLIQHGLGALALAGGFLALEGISAPSASAAFVNGKYVLDPLPYPYAALEPHIDAQTMQLHHDLHHQAYVTGLNNALDKLALARQSNDLSLVKHWSRETAFHGAGHFLHTLFWANMGPNSGGEPVGDLAGQLMKDFGGFAAFKAHFSAAAAQVEGSGWAILAWEPNAQQLLILELEKHQNQMAATVVPLLVLDVWEHAYYLKYQNRRADYVTAWWNVVNWPEVSRRLAVVHA